MHSLRIVAAVAALLASGCIPLVVGPNNFTPAGEMGEAPHSLGLAVEASRPLTDGTHLASGQVAHQALWLSEDLNLRIPVDDSLAVEGQLKAASFSPVPLPVPVGVSLGARRTMLRQATSGVSLDLVGRGLAMTTEYTDNVGKQKLKGSAYGVELQAPVSYRPASWFAATLTPFTRMHLLNATIEGLSGGEKTSQSGFAWGTGLSLSVEFKVSVIALAPALAYELVRAPSGEVVLSQAEPGLWLGARW